MDKYARFILGTEQIEFAPINKGNILNYNLNVEAMTSDGYKLYVDLERPTTNRRYYIEFNETDNTIEEVIVYEETQEEADLRELSEAKTAKFEENTIKAKEAIEDGYVLFKEAQFETNAQTVGDLTATMLLMQASGMETYTWLSRDDKEVELTLEDFGTLGGIIAGYKNSVWNNKYINYKISIEEATTKEDIEAIIIDYTTNEE